MSEESQVNPENKTGSTYCSTQVWAALISSIIFIASMYLCYNCNVLADGKRNAIFSISALTIVTPIWFWAEFAILRDRTAALREQKFEEFKYAQDLSKNIWLAEIAVLVFIYHLKS